MKKTIKLLISVFSVICFSFSVFSVIKGISNIKYYSNKEFLFYLDRGYFVKFEIWSIIFWIICCLSNLLLFLIINIKSLKFITDSLIEKIAKKKKENEPIRKEKALQKKQEQLQALQDEIKQMKNGE